MERARRIGGKEEKRYRIVLRACAMRVGARPVATSVPTPLSRLARRRGQLDAVSTRVPTPGNASVDGGVVSPRDSTVTRAGDAPPESVRNSQARSRREKSVRGRKSGKKKGYTRVYGAPCRTLASIMLHFLREVIFLGGIISFVFVFLFFLYS